MTKAMPFESSSTTTSIEEEASSTRPSPRLRKWIVLAILVFLFGLVFQLGLMLYAFYVLIGVLLLSRFLSRDWLTHLYATRECSSTRAEIGDKVALIITLEHRGTLPIIWLLLEDSLPHSAIRAKPKRIRLHGKRHSLISLRGKAKKSLRYQITFDMRGYYQLGPLLVESGDLFGLHRRYRVLTDPVYVLVLPKLIPLTGYDFASRRPIGEVRLVHRLFEDPTRIIGVQSYQAGDPLSRIHWRASARTG